MGKKLMAGKTAKSKGKKLSHGNSHVTPEDVVWDDTKRKWILVEKKQDYYDGKN